MDLDDFRQRLADLAPSLTAWGQYVESQVKRLASEIGVHPQITSSRVKEIESAVGKLSRKPYKSPLIDMTDLVGVRIVCLLSPDIKRLGDGVLASTLWCSVLAKDPVAEIQKLPSEFGYQSLHYEIRTVKDLDIDGVIVPEGTCCELQVRTLMQHVFAEVAHDNIYKNSWQAPTRALRFVSSSAALMETADHLFCETMTLLEEDNKQRGELLERLTTVYDRRVHLSSSKDQRFNKVVIDEYQDMIVESFDSDLETLLNNKPFIIERIKQRLRENSFWSQPVSLLAYWLVTLNPSRVSDTWPYGESEELHLVFSDLGKSYHQG